MKQAAKRSPGERLEVSTSDGTDSRVVIIGAGLAGLSCALTLEASGVAVTLLEAESAPGGRVRTDLVEGFRLDRGFQVLLTAYPEAKRLLDYSALDLKKFEPGALVWHGGKSHRLTDPLRSPIGAISGIFDGMVPLKDKLQVVRLRAKVMQGTCEAIFAREEKTTREYLKAFGFTNGIMDRFFIPFFGGVFLERDLVTSSRFFEFLFRMFAAGATAIPASGMEQIPLQLASKLRVGSLVTQTRVREVVRVANGFHIATEDGRVFAGQAIVLAVRGNQGNALLAKVGGWRMPEVETWNRTTTFYYVAERPAAQHDLLHQPILLLNGEAHPGLGTGAAPVNHAAVMSAVSPSYAPPGAHLIAANIVGQAPEDAQSLSRLDISARAQMTQWFGPSVSQWRRLAAYPIREALPLQRHAEWEQSPVRLAGAEGIYMCGDYRETASTQGALASGRRAAEAVARDLKANRSQKLGPGG